MKKKKELKENPIKREIVSFTSECHSHIGTQILVR